MSGGGRNSVQGPPSYPTDEVKALESSALKLLDLEISCCELILDIMRLEMRAYVIFSSLRNDISFLLVVEGGGYIMLNLPYWAGSTFTVSPVWILIPFLLFVFMFITKAKERLRAMIPRRVIITSKISVLVTEAGSLRDLEAHRQSRTVSDNGIEKLHASMDSTTVVSRSTAIINSRDLSRIEKNYDHLIYYAIFCNIVHVAVVCGIIYFMYWCKWFSFIFKFALHMMSLESVG